MNKAIFLSLFISFLTVGNSSCQKRNMLISDFKVETRFQLGEKDFFEMSKDTTSYLPDEIISYPPYLFFTEKYSINIIEFNTISKKKKSLTSLNSVLKQYHKKELSSQIQQLEVGEDFIIVLFQNHFFKFNRRDQRLVTDFSIDPFAYFFVLKDMLYASVSPSGNKITFYNSSGRKIRNIESLAPLGGFMSSSNHHYFISNTYNTIVMNEDSLKLGTSPSIKIPFTSDEKSKYVLLAATDDVLFWADVTNINKIVVTRRTNNYSIEVFDIDKKIINDSDVTKFQLLDFPGADPPEARQYFRLASDGKSIFVMFQSKGYVNLYSFVQPF